MKPVGPHHRHHNDPHDREAHEAHEAHEALQSDHARPPAPALSRILICRSDNLGDVVLTLPLAGYLKQVLPGVQVDFLCRGYAAPLVRQCRHVDQVLVLEELTDPARRFADEAYDAVIFAFPNRRLAQAARRARIAQRVGTSHRFYHWYTCNRLAHFSRVRSLLHEAQLNFELLRPLGIVHVPELGDIGALYGLAAPRLAAVDALRESGSFNVVLHPKSNGNGREWPLAHYAALALRLQSVPGARVWVTGSAAEGELLEREIGALFAMPHVRNLCGRFDLAGLTALIGSADGLVASGTGPLHIAAALGRPALGLFPPIAPIHVGRWGALGPRAQSLCAERRCATCTGNASCTCMHAISVDAVAAAVLGWREDHLKQLDKPAALPPQTALIAP
ncbi:glycosyltransferase family 9 protein [Massilia psychrophila]|uniref:Glycosyl transferase n=1 Tax=Massilia psychrophila TaxID=1603353 RepID=A0A2G8SWI6_9BURK|nr:glycosyltransferase family 9 protein [Massilia psychrophila]PIL38166.1 glycosyl transferase [Massilia psychrophila]GGE91001.1 ADP-heptose--LPS heptosyltransferase II [Massilia psychrophila]